MKQFFLLTLALLICIPECANKALQRKFDYVFGLFVYHQRVKDL